MSYFVRNVTQQADDEDRQTGIYPQRKTTAILRHGRGKPSQVRTR